MKKFLLYLILSIYCILMGACNLFEVRNTHEEVVTDSVFTIDSATAQMDTTIVIDSTKVQHRFAKDSTLNIDTPVLAPSQTVNTRNVHPDTVVEFAKSLVGTPYVYASTDPKVGFDCSGFITYVFNHFHIAVPRSSIDFTHVGKTVPINAAKRGDLILFTGTDSTEKAIGHMGLVISNNNGELEFVHSSSGKAMGVTITPLNDYYKKRFVRVARIFSQNDAT